MRSDSMGQGNFWGEPFDLRLTVLRLIRNLWKLCIITLAGTIVFGGGYWLKNVVLREVDTYEAVSVLKISYVHDPAQSGDYFINEATWNTYVNTDAFREPFKKHLIEAGGWNGEEDPCTHLYVTIATDLLVPYLTSTASDPDSAIRLAKAAEKTLTEEFAAGNEQVRAITVLDPGVEAKEVRPDVRPLRAVILSAVLSCFFGLVVLLLKELGDDSIWLPATLRKRYGLKAIGTINSVEYEENLRYLFGEQEEVCVCALGEDTDPAEVIKRLEQTPGQRQWIPVPSVSLCPEAAERLRETPKVLLVVSAGSHAGKPLEGTMEFFATQDIKVTAALLWEADEWLIRSYYRIPGALAERS